MKAITLFNAVGNKSFPNVVIFVYKRIDDFSDLDLLKCHFSFCSYEKFYLELPSNSLRDNKEKFKKCKKIPP